MGIAGWLAEELIWPEDRDGARIGLPIRLLAGRCGECGRCSFPSTGMCTWCGAATQALSVGASGCVVATTAVLHKTPGSDIEVPYLVALARFEDVELDILGRLTDSVGDIEPGRSVVVVADSPFPDGQLHYGYSVNSGGQRQ